MGIKFKSKTTTGIPVDGTVKERELHFNLVDETIYTSSNGTDVIEIGKETGGNAWSPTTQYKLGDMVATTPGGFIHHAVRNNIGQDPTTDTGDDWTQSVAAPLGEVSIAMFINTVSETASGTETKLNFGSNTVTNPDFTLSSGDILINRDMQVKVQSNCNFFNDISGRSEISTNIKLNSTLIDESVSRGYIRGDGELDNTSCYGHAIVDVVANDIISLVMKSLTTDSVTKVGECSIMIQDTASPVGATGADGLTGATGPSGGAFPPGGTTGQHLEKVSNADYDAEWVDVSQGVPATQVIVDGKTDKIDYVTSLTLAEAAQWDEKVSSDTTTALTGIKVDNMVVCTQAQYDGITPDATTIYMIRD